MEKFKLSKFSIEDFFSKCDPIRSLLNGRPRFLLSGSFDIYQKIKVRINIRMFNTIQVITKVVTNCLRWLRYQKLFFSAPKRVLLTSPNILNCPSCIWCHAQPMPWLLKVWYTNNGWDIKQFNNVSRVIWEIDSRVVVSYCLFLLVP